MQVRFLCGEELGRVQCGGANKLEHVAMETICARFGDGVHHRPAEFSIFGVETVGNKPELFDRIEIGNQACTEVAALAHVASVN